MSAEKVFFQKAFSVLKPACDAFITEPNDVNTKHLNGTMDTIPEYALQQLQPYILIPLEIHLKINKSNWTLNALDVLMTLLKKTSIDLWPTFIRIYTMLVGKLSNQKNPDMVANISEDVKLSVIINLNLLIEKADINILSQMYNELECKKVGYLIYVCTIIIKHEKMNSLRLEAIKCIRNLSSILDYNFDSDLHIKIILSFTKFVPGILSICSIIVNATDIQHHSITVAALNLWSTITSLIICDDHIIEDCNPYLGKMILEYNENDTKRKLNEWIKENNENFKLVASHMNKTREHQHWRVRLQLVNSCDILLNKCSSSMMSSVTNLIETLIILSDDEQPEVEKVAKESLNKLHSIVFYRENKKSLIDLLEESFYIFLSRIPRIIRTSNYTKQKIELSLLSGYIQLFGKTHLTRVLNSYAHLDRLTTVLIEILELEYKTITLLEESSIKDLNNIQQITNKKPSNVPWRQLIHFNDTSAFYKIESLCKLIGLYGDCNFIGRYLMDIFESKILYRREITLLMNIVLSENDKECQSHYSIVKDIMELYLERDVWYLPTSVDKYSSINIADAQKNMVQICLMTEGLAQLVSSLPVSEQSLCLIHCLYPILERLGSEHGPISLAGQEAIILLAQSGGYDNPIHLVVKNSDYLSHHFTTRLWSISDHPEVLNALKVVMNLQGSSELLQSFHSVVTDVLVQSYDFHRTENIQSFMKVFHIFVICVRKWQQGNMSISTSEHAAEKPKPSSDCVVENILEYHKMINLDFEDEYWKSENFSNIPCENIDENIDEENEKPLPPYVQMVLSIMKRVLHYLPSKHNFLPLQILNEGLIVISNYENHLLPMVHQIWSPLCTKFNNNTDDMIFREAFNVLTTMASTSKDFIRSRSLNQVLPTVVKRLTSSAKESKNISKESVYFTNNKYKMQYTVLSNLGRLVLNLNLIEKDLYDIFSAVANYLEKDQPTSLQEKSKEFYKTLYTKHSDFTWIYLQSLYIDEYEYKSENDRLPTIKVCSLSKFKKSNISKNISELFKSLDI